MTDGFGHFCYLRMPCFLLSPCTDVDRSTVEFGLCKYVLMCLLIISQTCVGRKTSFTGLTSLGVYSTEISVPNSAVISAIWARS